MNRDSETIPRTLHLRAGELVEVRSKEEILSTLDRDGCLDGMPFMPEMFDVCGRRLRVYKRAHKTCDTIRNTGRRRVESAVHLEGCRCDGRAHGGCQAECLIFWKEAWLKRISDVPPAGTIAGPSPAAASSVQHAGSSGCTEGDVWAHARRADGAVAGEPVYMCQATQLLRATAPIPWWDARHYWEDYTSGNYSPRWMFGAAGYAGYAVLLHLAGKWGVRRLGLRSLLFRIGNAVQKMRGKSLLPRTPGRIPMGGRTPATRLDLQPGELVRVKRFETILDTIDRDYRNRGLRWDAEMVPYCGGVYRVRKRVKQIIDERTGKMLNLKSEPLILDGVVCQSRYSEGRYFCPRSIYSYWQEVWLERVLPDEADPARQSETLNAPGRQTPPASSD